MTMHKYFTFYIDNNGAPNKIANAMRTLDVHMASDEDVSRIFYGLRRHNGGKVVIEGYMHFYDRQEGHMVAIDMLGFHLWPAKWADILRMDRFLDQGHCMFTKYGARSGLENGVGVIKMNTKWYYHFEL